MLQQQNHCEPAKICIHQYIHFNPINFQLQSIQLNLGPSPHFHLTKSKNIQHNFYTFSVLKKNKMENLSTCNHLYITVYHEQKSNLYSTFTWTLTLNMALSLISLSGRVLRGSSRVV